MPTSLILTGVIFALLLLLAGNLLVFWQIFKVLLSQQADHIDVAAPRIKKVFRRPDSPTTPELVKTEADDIVQHVGEDTQFKNLEEVDQEVLAAAIQRYRSGDVPEEEA